ncbi:lipopolysaccharide transport periplasmic protein LptA [Kushneria aurantia]|uniref:Lipopolysaccharide export system protein LptA n=1 Tax=Kushneria aurantia TaxID=504092 RepID=A0ABV6G002_9GAMM|nr:lipopolysaccharide transport periplasmic protein LptA [Kushneria aurantia]
MMRSLLCSTLALLALSGTPALALESDRNQPINISADALEISDQDGTAVYTGAVEVDQGSMQLRANRVELQRAESGGLSQMTATGGEDGRAYIEQRPAPDDPLARGWGNRIVYHAGERRVELIGNAELHQGSDIFTGGYVEYFLDTRRVNARGNEQSEGGDGRVRMQLTPAGQQDGSAQ